LVHYSLTTVCVGTVGVKSSVSKQCMFRVCLMTPGAYRNAPGVIKVATKQQF